MELISLNVNTIVSWTESSGTPCDEGKPNVKRPEPDFANNASECP